jgi:Acetoacetate decarboxylase (ADC)
MTVHAQPTYIDRGGEQVYMPAFTAKGTRLFGFAVASDREVQQTRICDRYLNAPLGGRQRFVAALEQVFFVFNTVDSLVSTAPGWEDKGWFSEQEAAVWMLVADLDTERLFWFHPYMLVDNAYALCMGREIYGFPKALGWFDIAPGPDAPERMGVETLAVKVWGEASQGQRYPLFSVRRVGEPDGSALIDTLSEATELMGELVSLSGLNVGWFERLGLAAHSLDDLLHLRLPMVFLKQFRDGLDPSRCCYQAIQEVSVQLTAFHGARIYTNPYELDIVDLASHPIRADLGLASGPIAVDYAFWTDFDFTIGPCTALWSTSA